MAQINAATLQSDATSLLPDNTTALINPVDVRERVVDISDSVYFKLDAPQAGDVELAALTETDIRMFSPADLLAASHTMSDSDGDTTIELNRGGSDPDYIYLKAGGTDMVEVRATQVLVGSAATGVLVNVGANKITLDGEILLADFPSSRNDTTTSRALFVDASGNLQHGNIVSSGGALIEDSDNDTYINTEATTDSDEIVIYTAGVQRGEFRDDGDFKMGDFSGIGSFIEMNGNDFDISTPSGGLVNFYNSNGDGMYMGLGLVSPAVNFIGMEIQFSSYPNSRNDGSTNKCFYADSSGNILYGDIIGAGAGGTSISDADGNTKIQTEESANENIIRFDVDGTERITISATEFLASYGSQRLLFNASEAKLGENANMIHVHATNEETKVVHNSLSLASFSLQNSTAPRVRLGDYIGTNNGTYIDIADNAASISFHPSGDQRFTMTTSAWEIGDSSDDYIKQDSSGFEVYANNIRSLLVSDEFAQLGNITGTGLAINHASASEHSRIYSQGVIMFEINESGASSQIRVGDYDETDPTYLHINSTSDTIDGHVGGSQFLAVTDSQVDIGHSTTTNRITGSAHEFRVSNRLVGSLGETLQTIGDSAATGNSSFVEVDDTAQTIKIKTGGTTFLDIAELSAVLGNTTTYIKPTYASNQIEIVAGSNVYGLINSTSARIGSTGQHVTVTPGSSQIEVDATNIIFDQHKARTDTQQDFALTLDGSGNLNRAKINAKHSINVALSAETGDLTESTSVPVLTSHQPYKFRLEDVVIGATTAPTGADILVDIHKNGTSIFATRVSIDAGEDVSTTATTPFDFTASATDVTISKGDKLEFFIDQKGSTVAGAGLKCYLVGTIIP